MHYVIFKNDNEIVKKPITVDEKDNIPDIAKELATVAERYGSHIEIDATTGTVYMADDGEPIHPTMQVCRAVESQYVYDKYGEPAAENIKKVPNKYLSDDFKGSFYIYQYITKDEFQGSIIILNENGQYASTYDELEEAFVPPIEGLDEKAVSVAKQVFETLTESYKNLIKQAISTGTIK